MFRILFSTIGLFSLICYCEQEPAAAQDAQHEASAVVARQHGEAAEAAVATPTIVGTPPTDNASNQALAPKLDTIKRGVGELNGSAAHDRANVLGMYLQEGAKGQVRIVDVGAASPAYDAGIKRGDVLVQLENFKGDNYRKWIDGIRQIVTKAPDGSQLPVILVRNGKTITTQIRVPVSSVGRLQLPVEPVGMPPQAGQILPSESQSNVVGVPVAGTLGGIDVAIQNGPFNSFFRDQSPTAERAMAELVRIGAKQSEAVNPQSADTPHDTIAPPGSAGTPNSEVRIGMAGFRNESNGMMVMVDIGTLEPGNYTVALSDPAVLRNSSQPGPMPRVPSRSGPAASLESQPRDATSLPTVSVPPATQTKPQDSAISSQTPVDAIPPLGPPATGGRVTLPTLPESPTNPSPNIPRNPTFGELGTLTVDQSGTGRMQHISEGLQVQNVIGQAIAIYRQTETPSATLPPDLNPTIDPAAKSNAPQAPKNNPTASSGKISEAQENSAKPVAGGIIRLVSDRNPPPNTANPLPLPNAATPQPANNSPAVPQGTVR